MDSGSSDQDWIPPFYIAQHESKRVGPVNSWMLDQAMNCNYDMLTIQITNDHFHSRVLALLSDAQAGQNETSRLARPIIPSVPALTRLDTHLSPSEITSQLLAMTSPWIDMCSPDPIISGISKQVFLMEIAYAAFCGIEYIFVQGPRLSHEDVLTFGVPQYARAIQEALVVGSHMQVSIMLPMIDDPEDEHNEDIGSLARFTRDEYLDDAQEMKSKKKDYLGTWDAWNVIRSLCKYSPRLFVALAIPRYLPPLSVQSRWYSEPLKLISFTDNTFRRNKEGCPTLLGITQSYITRLMRLKTVPWILLGDVGPLPGLDDPDELVTAASGHLSPDAAADASSSPTPAEATQMKRKSSKKTDDPLAHLRYLRYLQHNQPRRSSVEQYGSGYQDYLQIPLQPLADNLESMTYEVFEKDPVKYDLYEQAIGAALRDWAESGKPTSNRDGKVVVAVAGAGRGPLVTRALRASESECVEIELWAVEKNPNAYVILQRHNQEDWQNQVTVVKSDMRSWKGPWRPGPVSQSHGDPMSSGKSSNEPNITAGGKSSLLPGSQTKHAPLDSPNGSYGRIDILISELLGSFADNELSPECLDGILHLLSPQGISIPRSYTAYLTPIAAPRLHADISARTSWDPTAPETPSVVWLHAVDYLSLSTSNTEAGSENLPHTSPTPAQPMTSSPSPTPNILPVWEFAHEPLPEQKGGENGNSHNERFAKLNFRTRSRGVCHGLGGYFESVLYPGIELSTNPNTMEAKSNAMMSWFPIYFPLKTPLYIPDHAAVTVSMWRQTDDRKVWYEWMLETWGWNFMVGGEKKRVRLGQSELHSSIKGGCLM